MKTAFITISIGKRPWADTTRKLLKKYTDSIGADLIVEDSFDDDEILQWCKSQSSPRKNLHAYVMKSLVVEKYLKIYDRITVIDDAYCIKPSSENIFDIVPEGELGYLRHPYHQSKIKDHVAHNSFDMIKRFYGNINMIYDEKYYSNSSLVVYSKIHQQAFSRENIKKCLPLFLTNWPHQTYMYYTCMSNKLKMFEIPEIYHVIPGMYDMMGKDRATLKSALKYINSETRGCHITGRYNYREKLLKEVCELWM